MNKRVYLLLFFLVTWPFFVGGFVIGSAFWLAHTGFYRALEFQKWLTDLRK